MKPKLRPTPLQRPKVDPAEVEAYTLTNTQSPSCYWPAISKIFPITLWGILKPNKMAVANTIFGRGTNFTLFVKDPNLFVKDPNLRPERKNPNLLCFAHH